MAQAAVVRRDRDALAALARRLAAVTPREGEWERSYRALQREARAVLHELAGDEEIGEVPAGALEADGGGR